MLYPAELGVRSAGQLRNERAFVKRSGRELHNHLDFDGDVAR